MNTKSEKINTVLQVTKALSDIQRVRILMMLRQGELCVCQIIEVLGLAPSTVSKHLSILSAARLVDSRKEARWMYYKLPEKKTDEIARSVLKWLDAMLENDGTIEQDEKKLTNVVAVEPEKLCLRQRKRNTEGK